jgi:2-hydroxycyclohexanecarboxyl-CoA dehydrogenase
MQTGLAGRTDRCHGRHCEYRPGDGTGVSRPEGANSSPWAATPTPGRRLCELALAQGAKDVMWQSCDVTDYARVQTMTDAILERFDGVDVLVNNVARATSGMDAFVVSDPATWDDDITLNMTSVAELHAHPAPGNGRAQERARHQHRLDLGNRR